MVKQGLAECEVVSSHADQFNPGVNISQNLSTLSNLTLFTKSKPSIINKSRWFWHIRSISGHLICCPMTNSGFSQEIVDSVQKIIWINSIFTACIVNPLSKQTANYYIPRANIFDLMKFQTKYKLRFLSIIPR